MTRDKWSFVIGDGLEWVGKVFPVIAFAGPFSDKAAADEWAQAHDMEV